LDKHNRDDSPQSHGVSWENQRSINLDLYLKYVFVQGHDIFFFESSNQVKNLGAKPLFFICGCCND